MATSLQLIGIDVGSTTTRIAIADARMLPGGAAGRPELGQLEERLRTEPARTPFRGDALDAEALLALVDGAIADGGARPGAFFGGGALVTGLAARAPNAAAVVDALRARVGDAVVATAGDPRLEAWLAFHGNAGALSRAAPERRVLNLDIGGGTTNLAVGRAGEVVATGWMWIGARHVEVAPGGHRLVRCSPEARRTLGRLGIEPRAGEPLSPRDVERLLDAWIAVLEGAVTGAPGADSDALVPAPLALPAEMGALDLAFSGGVGGLVYDALAGRALPPTTAYGDLGIELAARIARSPVLAARVLVPEGRGRATVYGLLRHQTQISGATVWLPGDQRCPTGDLPILGSLGPDASAGEIARLVALARAARPAGAIVVRGPLDGRALRDLGRALGAALDAALGGGLAPAPHAPAPHAALVVLLEQNLAKALGGYATEWGRRPLPLVVLDEVLPHGAELVRIGAPRGDLVPVSFFGMGP
ncbi:MAG TPA: ethanolamine ammonia-lyase reactivating factor EutA [Kofleriaceae bacterium]|nr:ethanolamine ammonia-lyase reactivating factor EutA [Kofleriaceae bacterium]